MDASDNNDLTARGTGRTADPPKIELLLEQYRALQAEKRLYFNVIYGAIGFLAATGVGLFDISPDREFQPGALVPLVWNLGALFLVFLKVRVDRLSAFCKSIETSLRSRYKTRYWLIGWETVSNTDGERSRWLWLLLVLGGLVSFGVAAGIVQAINGFDAPVFWWNVGYLAITVVSYAVAAIAFWRHKGLVDREATRMGRQVRGIDPRPQAPANPANATAN